MANVVANFSATPPATPTKTSTPTNTPTATATQPANQLSVKVWVGTDQPGNHPIGVGQALRVNYQGFDNGPVKMMSSTSNTIIGSEAVIYKINGANTSFSEMMALPASQLSNTYWLPWYNNVNLDTQLRFANVSSQSAQVRVFIGGQEMQGSPFNLLPGASTQQSFTGINNGPVEIVSTQNIVAAERVIYKVNGIYTSFSEMMGLPNGQLDTTYWLPWYNNINLNSDLRLGVP
jgi:hypothetical protein